MNIKIRAYNAMDISSMIGIWNEVVEEGIAFPQENCLILISVKNIDGIALVWYNITGDENEKTCNNRTRI